VHYIHTYIHTYTHTESYTRRGTRPTYFRFCPLLLCWRHKDYAANKETKRKINKKEMRDRNAKSDYTLEHNR